MAKGRVGVLEAHESPALAEPQTRCGRAIAEYLVETGEATRIGKRLIQMVKARARDAITQAKAARDAVQAVIDRIMFWDGPLGVGNLLPFARLHNYGDKLHYEMPMAGDVGMRRHGLYRRDDEIRSHTIPVSSRSLFNHQVLPMAVSA